MKLEQSLKGHFLNLYQIALADSTVDTKELEMLYRIGEERGVSKNEIEEAVVRPDILKFSTPETVFEKVECLYDFARIAWADGTLDPNEKRLMEMFCEKFGFRDENITAIVQFLLDEVAKGTSKDEILKIVNENM